MSKFTKRAIFVTSTSVFGADSNAFFRLVLIDRMILFHFFDHGMYGQIRELGYWGILWYLPFKYMANQLLKR